MSSSPVRCIVFGFRFSISNSVWLPPFQCTMKESFRGEASSTSTSSTTVLTSCFLSSMGHAAWFQTSEKRSPKAISDARSSPDTDGRSLSSLTRLSPTRPSSSLQRHQPIARDIRSASADRRDLRIREDRDRPCEAQGPWIAPHLGRGCRRSPRSTSHVTPNSLLTRNRRELQDNAQLSTSVGHLRPAPAFTRGANLPDDRRFQQPASSRRQKFCRIRRPRFQSVGPSERLGSLVVPEDVADDLVVEVLL